MTDNVISTYATRIMFFSLAAAIAVFVGMLLLTIAHP